MFYYSGHGHIDAVGGYLVTPDYAEYDYGLSLQDVLTIANKSKCKERIIILDSCHSGFMGNISTNGQNTAIRNDGEVLKHKLQAALSQSNQLLFFENDK